MKKILLMLLTFCMSINIYAQNTPVKGKVVDEKGETLVGAVVKIKDGKEGTATDINGNFSISVPIGATLTASYLGYNNADVRVVDYKPLTITLNPNGASDLNEVVVIGYGTTKKVTLTGSVASVTGKDVLETPDENILNSLAGKLPGVRIAQNTAQPGSYNVTYDIRGFAANGGGAATGSPLVVIDGVPSDYSTFSRLDPNDIDNVSVLKDASAAIYGVKAGNGVILVTTKRGQAGTSKITYNLLNTYQYMNKVPEMANAVQWMTLYNESTMHTVNSTPITTYPASAFTPYLNGTLQSTDWRNALLRNGAPEMSQNITASGGTDKVNYFISGGYNYQDSFYKIANSDYDSKYNFRTNVDAKISKRLTASIQLSGIFDQAHSPYASPFGEINVQRPIDPIYANNDPKYPYATQVATVANPIVETNPDLSGYNLNKTDIFHGGVGLTYDVPYIEGLKAKILYNYDYNVSDNKNYTETYTTYLPASPATNPATYVAYQVNSPSSVSRTYSTGNTSYLQWNLDYNHTFAKVHNVEVLALYEQSTSQSDNFNAYRQEVLNSDQIGAGAAALQQGGYSGGIAGYSTRKSYVGRVHYDYESKYLVDFSIRRDGESTFPPSNPYGVFPGVQAAYRISEEPFIKNNKSLSFIDNIKIRGSYGIAGDDAGVQGYQFLTGYAYPAPNNSAEYTPQGAVFNGNYVSAVGFLGLPNTNITWYTDKQTDVGLDAEFWQGKFGFTFDYYNRLRSGLFGTAAQALPGSVGAPLPQVNENSDETRGYELALTSNNRFGEFGLNIGLNGSYARTKWVNYVEARGGNDYADWINNYWKNNRYNDTYFGYGYVGQYQSFQQIRSATVNGGGGNRAAVPGDFIFQDWNNDGAINGADVHPIATTQPIGGNATLPLVNYGMNIAANYKNFDLDLQIQGAASRYLSYPIWYSYPLDHQRGTFAYFYDRWHPADPTANPYDPNTKYIPGYFPYTSSNPNTEQQDSKAPNGIQNGSYVRLKSFQLGYSLPTNLLKKVGIARLRIFASGYDLWTITGMKYLDPEHPIESNGADYPLNHTYSFGVNATF